MAQRIRATSLTDSWKAKISATKLCQRLQSHVDGELELSSTQIKAAQILLGKVAPDLSRAEISGDPNAPMRIIHESK